MSTLPESLIRLPQVEARTGYKRSNIYAMVRAGTFPPPVPLGPRASAWVESEVQIWIKGRIDARHSTQQNTRNPGN